VTIRLGVDIGGTGIKSAPVDLEQGALVGDRRYVAIPRIAAVQPMDGCILCVVDLMSDEMCQRRREGPR
jgi:polyphosphate glucokinase